MGSRMFPVVAVDDGHNDTKTAFQPKPDTIKRSRFASIAVSGNQVGMTFSGDTTGDVYSTDNDMYTILPSGTGLDTRTPDYPLSPLNRVLVAHALYLIHKDTPEYLKGEYGLVTGLPLREWKSMDVKLRKDKIKAKQHNLAEPVMRVDEHWARPVPASQMVVPEAVAAYVYGVESGRIRKGSDVAIIDVGGRTLDIAVITMNTHNMPELDRERSQSEDMGVLYIRDQVRQALIERLQTNQIKESIVDNVMQRGESPIRGEIMDFRDVLQDSCRLVSHKMENLIKKAIGEGMDLDKICFVGGGVNFVQSLSKIWPHAVMWDIPEYANASGMLLLGQQSWSK